jgi:hypothetical protein
MEVPIVDFTSQMWSQVMQIMTGGKGGMTPKQWADVHYWLTMQYSQSPQYWGTMPMGGGMGGVGGGKGGAMGGMGSGMGGAGGGGWGSGGWESKIWDSFIKLLFYRIDVIANISTHRIHIYQRKNTMPH